jgi:hypothetical protein
VRHGNPRRTVFKVATIVLFVLLIVAIIMYYFVPYDIENWQIEVNSANWKVSVETSERIQNFNVTKIYNVNRYKSALMEAAIQAGISQQEMKRSISVSDKQGPEKKIPVLIKTAFKDNIPVVIVFYKWQLVEGWGKEWQEQWFVVMQRNDGRIIMSDGTL